METSKKRSDCPLRQSLDVFGDKWSLLIIRDLMFGNKCTYNDFLKSEEGIATNILATRLKGLEENGVIEKSAHPDSKAKILYKPILVSNFPSAKDQITSHENGIIVPLNAESIAAGIENLIQDSELRAKLISNLKRHHYGTESEINKLYQLIDN